MKARWQIKLFKHIIGERVILKVLHETSFQDSTYFGGFGLLGKLEDAVGQVRAGTTVVTCFQDEPKIANLNKIFVIKKFIGDQFGDVPFLPPL